MKPIRKMVPTGAQDAGRGLALQWGRATARLRDAPSFLLVGAQRCGTTSLFRALMEHPNILRPVLHKGVNYFDVDYDKGWNWYLGHFPLRANASRHAPAGHPTAETFEASGYYMFHPHAPHRIAADLPSVKIVAMVRDPVERAYSAYKHEFARGFETESFEDALRLEDDRVEPELAGMLADEAYQSQVYRHQAYRRRGQYAEQLRAFDDLLGGGRVHVVDSERFFTEPEKEYARLLTFLELPLLMPASFDRFNARPGTPMTPDVEASLRAHFEPHDQSLEDFLGWRPSWRP
jgi:Sulfotransferase domain